MSLVLLVVVIGVLNICVGFALGVYVQSTRHASSGISGCDDDLPLDDNFSPYRSLANGSDNSRAAAAAAEQPKP
jgi:hypothetical protein